MTDKFILQTRPDPCEAMQWDGTSKSAREIYDWYVSLSNNAVKFRGIEARIHEDLNPTGEVKKSLSIDGHLLLLKDDWLVYQIENKHFAVADTKRMAERYEFL